MSTTLVTHTDPELEPVWDEAEAHIIGRIASTSRWDAERWTAIHERVAPPVSVVALQAWYMQAAIDGGRDDRLTAGFERIDEAVAGAGWADPGPWSGEARLAVTETARAVAELGRQALAAAVLADVIVDRTPASRRAALERAGEIVRLSPLFEPAPIPSREA